MAVNVIELARIFTLQEILGTPNKVEQPALQLPRGVAVRAGMAEKDEGRGLIHARRPRHLSEARPRLAIAKVPLAALSRAQRCAIDPPRDVFAS
jgi:hypothetical protein